MSFFGNCFLIYFLKLSNVHGLRLCVSSDRGKNIYKEFERDFYMKTIIPTNLVTN